MTKTTFFVGSMRRFLTLLFALTGVFASLGVHAQAVAAEEKLSPGDSIRIKVYQNPDLSFDTVINDNGSVSFPLIRTVKLLGLTLPQAEELIEKSLQSGGFVEKPHVIVTLTQMRMSMVYVLGDVAKPGKFSLERKGTRLTELLATVGGVSAGGAPVVTVSGMRAGVPLRQKINLDEIFIDGKTANDITLADGDTLYVGRAPVFYIYGEVQRPGSFKIERHMTFIQALVSAGGPSAKGTERNLRVTRRSADGTMQELSPALSDLVQPDDMIFVRETLF